MKIIEGMKRIKANKQKIVELQNKIGATSAHLSIETPLYGAETADKINEWTQTCEDLTQENIRLLVAIQRTNLVTHVAIELGGRSVNKTIAEWIWRKREYANTDYLTWSKQTDRNLKEGSGSSSTGVPIEVKLVRNYNPEKRDKKLEEYRGEPHEIDARLEVVNAVTDLVEV